MLENSFTQDKYSAQEKEYMLSLARQAIEQYLKYKEPPALKEQALTDNLKENRPCFVTLMYKGRLRGCIGMFEFNTPLYKNIISRAKAAATEDSRFLPVTADELKDINIEISILTEPQDLKFSSPEDLLNKIKPFEDGVILYTIYGASTYLPQVWEQLPDKEEFLSNLCEKHGAPANYWKDNYKNTRVEIYKAVHFKEEGR
jgi:AmmeMemoRadiSam system protein A